MAGELLTASEWTEDTIQLPLERHISFALSVGQRRNMLATTDVL